jgi:hypothetical protein
MAVQQAGGGGTMTPTQTSQLNSLITADKQIAAFLTAVMKEANKFNAEVQGILTGKTNAEAQSKGV